METIANIVNVLPDIIKGTLLIVSGATVLVALTPTPKDDAIVGKIYKVISWLSGNVLFNKKD